MMQARAGPEKLRLRRKLPSEHVSSISSRTNMSIAAFGLPTPPLLSLTVSHSVTSAPPPDSCSYNTRCCCTPAWAARRCGPALRVQLCSPAPRSPPTRSTSRQITQNRLCHSARVPILSNMYDMTHVSSRLIGVQHQLWPDLFVKLLRRQEAKRHRGLLQRRALLVRLLRTLGNV